MGGYQPSGYELSGEPYQVNAARLGADVFPTLGVAPVLGRVFTQQEDDDGQHLAVLSYLTLTDVLPWRSSVRVRCSPHVTDISAFGAADWLDRTVRVPTQHPHHRSLLVRLFRVSAMKRLPVSLTPSLVRFLKPFAE